MTDPMTQISLRARWEWEGDQIEKRVDRRNTSALGRFGAYTRRRVRRLMNKQGGGSKGHSKAGEPPRKIGGQLRDSVSYQVDQDAGDVTVRTPAQFERTKYDVPGILEFGGSEVLHLGILFGSPGEVTRLVPVGAPEEEIREASRGRGGQFRQRRIVQDPDLPAVRVDYQPRPALVPAFDEMVEKHVPELWGDLI